MDFSFNRRTPSTRPLPGRRLLDEAFDLLSEAPARVLALYYLCTLPFVLFLAAFSISLLWNPRYSMAPVVISSALFLVMKTGHALFATELRARLCGFHPHELPVWTAPRIARVFLVQTILQPSGLFLLQLAGILVFPMAWTYSFYQNATALGEGVNGSTILTLRRAARATLFWPRQVHAALLIVTLLGLTVYLNVFLAAGVAPLFFQLIISRDPGLLDSVMPRLSSPALHIACVAIVYLSLDPLVKAFYVVRCFYIDSLRSGEDLQRELAGLPPAFSRY